LAYAVLAAEYGYVNRVIPDAGIEDVTDAFARRIASSDIETDLGSAIGKLRPGGAAAAR
jgi:hypothetical protein